MEALTLPSTPVLIYGVLVALFIIVAIPLGRMIEKANREDDERIELLKKHRKQ